MFQTLAADGAARRETSIPRRLGVIFVAVLLLFAAPPLGRTRRSRRRRIPSQAVS